MAEQGGYQRGAISPVTVALQSPRQATSAVTVLGKGLGALAEAGAEVVKVQRQVRDAEAEADFQIAQLEKQRRQSAFRAGMAGRLAQADVVLDGEAEKIPEYSAPGAVGYTAARTKRAGEVYDPLLAEAVDPEDREWLEPLVVQRKARTQVAAQNYEDATSRGYQADQLKLSVDAASNDLMRNPTGENLDAQLAAFDHTIGGLHLDGRTGPAMKAAGQRQLVGAMVDGLMQKGDHTGVTALLDSGKLDGILTPDEIKGYRGLAANQAALQEAKAEQARVEEQKAAKEGLNLIKVRINNGDVVPQGEIAAALARGKAAGVPDSELAEFAYLGEDALETQGVQGASTQALEASREQLLAKERAGKASPAERRQRGRIDEELKRRGGTDGQQIAPLFKGTPQQRMQGYSTLAGMTSSERFRVAGTTGNVKHAIIAGAVPEAQGWAVQGQMKREQNQAQYLPMPGVKGISDQQRRDQVRKDAQEVLGPAIWASIGPVREQIIDAGLDIMAGRRDDYSKPDFQNALRYTFGGSRRADGTGQGGLGRVNDNQMILPAQWNESEVQSYVNKFPFPGAIDGSGQPMRLQDLRRNHYFEFILEDGDGAFYYVKDRSGRNVLFKDGKGKVVPYVLKVPPRPGAR